METPQRETPPHSAIRSCELSSELQLLARDATLWTLFEKAAHMYSRLPFVGKRSGKKYEWISYSEGFERILRIGNGLRCLKIHSKMSPLHVGIIGPASPNFILADLAVHSQGMISVPIYHGTDLDRCVHVLKEAQVDILFTSEICLDLVTRARTQCPFLHSIVLMSDYSEAPPPQSLEAVDPIWTHTLADLEQLGSLHPAEPHTPTPTQTACILFTSGSTGKPKGAIWTHGALALGAIVGSAELVGPPFPPPALSHKTQERFFGYLPPAHILQYLLSFGGILQGGALGFYSGSPKELTRDCQALEPTVFPAVPQVLERLVKSIRQQATGLKGSLLARASAAQAGISTSSSPLGASLRGEEAASQHSTLRASLWDWTLLRSIRKSIGFEHLHTIITGSAPAPLETYDTLTRLFHVDILEGYGLTELLPLTLFRGKRARDSLREERFTVASSAIGATPLPSVCTLCGNDVPPAPFGTVGLPAQGTEIMLVDQAAQGHPLSEGRGEIWARSQFMFSGYLNDPESTAKTLAAGGWLKTGDAGQWAGGEKGLALRIVGRLKNTTKLANGEFVHVEAIEEFYTGHSSLLAQVMVAPNDTRQALVALVVPVHVNDPPSNQQVAEELRRVGEQPGLRPFERVARFALLTENFTPENGLATPTHKLNRPAISRRFEETLRGPLFEVYGARE
ncbi:putative Long-chain-fatty-acid--CoA ligase 1 [Paratrimastix pyriformis]|uniref:Long-chain-fatty-acid--CoA ligase 1 n=1 Tax=Paratrimastix pyriformis TaxID=342808 RepID=A0ABQ8UQ53_9EUKA|nr:putative Long-chain-fatty-acid--CoA ligase 1 [Paratrimastix pyriformis]